MISPFSPQSPRTRARLHGPRLVHQRRYLLVPRYRKLHEEPQWSTGQQDGGKIIKRYGDQEGPGGPLRKKSEPVGDEHTDDDQIPLVHGNRHLGDEDRHDPDDGEVKEEKGEGDGIYGETEVGDEEEDDLAAEEGEDDERGEGHVGFEESGAAEVEEEDEDESDDGDGGNKDEGAKEGARELVPDGGGGG